MFEAELLEKARMPVNSSSEQLDLLLVTDMGLFREGLAELLVEHESVASVQTASSVAEGLARAAQIQPDVSIVDAALLSTDVVQALLQEARDTRVVAFGVADEWEDVLACARAGVAGFVTRNCRLPDLIRAVLGARHGELICSPRTAARMFEHMNTLMVNGMKSGSDRDLTSRELEIAELLEHGLSNKEIARRLFIEHATVKNHVHNILSKLQVSRRGEAVARLRRSSRHA